MGWEVNSRNIVVIGVGAALVAAAAGLWGYPALREALFEREFTADFRKHHKAAVEKAKLVEDESQLREYYAWYVGGVRQVIAARHDEAPPGGRELLKAVGAIVAEFELFNKRCFDAVDALNEASAQPPGVIARSADGGQVIARLEAALELMTNFPQHTERSREYLRLQVSRSAAREKTRVVLWQSLQQAFEQNALLARAMPDRAQGLQSYLELLQFLHKNRDAYFVAMNGSLVFNATDLAVEYNRRVREIRFGQRYVEPSSP